MDQNVFTYSCHVLFLFDVIIIHLHTVSGTIPYCNLCSLQMDDDEVGLVRQKVIEIRQSWHKRNEEEVTKRWTFEEAVSL